MEWARNRKPCGILRRRCYLDRAVCFGGKAREFAPGRYWP